MRMNVRNFRRTVLGMIAPVLVLHPLIAPPAWLGAQTPSTGPAGKPATAASSPATRATTTSAPARALKLAIAGKSVDIQIVQGEMTIRELPPKGGIVLEPKPFTIKLKGDIGDFSILPLGNPKLFAAVRDSNRPFCTVDGTGGATSPNDLFIHTKKLEIFDGDKRGLMEACGPNANEDSDFVKGALQTIKDHFKVKPLILTSGHVYVHDEDEIIATEARIKIKTVDQKTPAAGQKIWLIMLLEYPLGEYLRELDWIEVPLEFASEK